MKRGQVTLFIIVGLIILIIVGFLLFLRSDALKSKLGLGRTSAIIVPEQLKPVKNNIDGCVKQVGEEAINILSLQGGYIKLPQDIMPRSAVNPYSNSLELYPG